MNGFGEQEQQQLFIISSEVINYTKVDQHKMPGRTSGDRNSSVRYSTCGRL